MTTSSLAVLGCGNMANALVRGMAAARLPLQYWCYDPDPGKAQALAAAIGGGAVEAIPKLPPCDDYLLCCKPQQAAELATELSPVVPATGTVISILAGTSTTTLRQHYPRAQSIIRVMPNLPCQTGLGVAGIFYASNTPTAVRQQVHAMFAATSTVIPITDEALMNAVTACTGSGPAYVFEFARALIDATAALGIEPALAKQMVLGLLAGATRLLQQSSESPETLRNQVTSKGGTTAAALAVLEQGAFAPLLRDALAAACQRAQELGR